MNLNLDHLNFAATISLFGLRSPEEFNLLVNNGEQIAPPATSLELAKNDIATEGESSESVNLLRDARLIKGEQSEINGHLKAKLVYFRCLLLNIQKENTSLKEMLMVWKGYAALTTKQKEELIFEENALLLLSLSQPLPILYQKKEDLQFFQSNVKDIVKRLKEMSGQIEMHSPFVSNLAKILVGNMINGCMEAKLLDVSTERLLTVDTKTFLSILQGVPNCKNVLKEIEVHMLWKAYSVLTKKEQGELDFEAVNLFCMTLFMQDGLVVQPYLKKLYPNAFSMLGNNFMKQQGEAVANSKEIDQIAKASKTSNEFLYINLILKNIFSKENSEENLEINNNKSVNEFQQCVERLSFIEKKFNEFNEHRFRSEELYDQTPGPYGMNTLNSNQSQGEKNYGTNSLNSNQSQGEKNAEAFLHEEILQECSLAEKAIKQAWDALKTLSKAEELLIDPKLKAEVEYYHRNY